MTVVTVLIVGVTVFVIVDDNTTPVVLAKVLDEVNVVVAAVVIDVVVVEAACIVVVLVGLDVEDERVLVDCNVELISVLL